MLMEKKDYTDISISEITAKAVPRSIGISTQKMKLLNITLSKLSINTISAFHQSLHQYQIIYLKCLLIIMAIKKNYYSCTELM